MLSCEVHAVATPLTHMSLTPSPLALNRAARPGLRLCELPERARVGACAARGEQQVRGRPAGQAFQGGQTGVRCWPVGPWAGAGARRRPRRPRRRTRARSRKWRAWWGWQSPACSQTRVRWRPEDRSAPAHAQMRVDIVLRLVASYYQWCLSPGRAAPELPPSHRGSTLGYNGDALGASTSAHANAPMPTA